MFCSRRRPRHPRHPGTLESRVQRRPRSRGLRSLFRRRLLPDQHFVSGIIHGRSDIQAYVQRGIDAKYRIDSIDVLATECSGDFAYAITRYHSINTGRNDIGVNLVILRKKKHRWLIVAHEPPFPILPPPSNTFEIPKGRPKFHNGL